MNTLPAIDALRERLVTLRHDLHAHPELAFAEHRTSERVAAFLRDIGITPRIGLAGTGVVGVLKAGDGTGAIALRADMDALPVQEQNHFPHRSRIDGRMHACGHDGHTAMLLGAAAYLAATRRFDGTVVFIFQPAEETDGGARVMIEQGLFRDYPVDAVFGMHNWPGLPAGQFAVHAGPVMACAGTARTPPCRSRGAIR
jgi:hippurate hydrolase